MQTLGALVLLLTPFVLTDEGSSVSQDTVLRDRIAITLARPLASNELASDRAEELAELGSGVVLPLVEALATGELATESVRVSMDPVLTDIALGSVARLSRTSVRTQLVALEQSEPDAGHRRAALMIYGVIGEGSDLRAMASMAARVDAREVVDVSVRQAFRDALGQVFARDEDTVTFARGAFDVAHPTVRALLVEGLRQARPEHALELLSELLGTGVEMDLVVLSAIDDVGRFSFDRVDPALLTAVRRYLSKGDDRLLQAGARAAGRLRDPRAVPDLLRMLDSPNANLRATADKALMEIAGRNFRGDSTKWKDWYERELGWWEDSEARLLRSLRSQSLPDIARALNEVAEHRLFRRELELSLVEQLGSKDPLIVTMACSSLGRLGSRAGMTELRELTAHKDRRIAEAARDACFRILGGARTPLRPCSRATWKIFPPPNRQ